MKPMDHLAKHAEEAKQCYQEFLQVCRDVTDNDTEVLHLIEKRFSKADTSFTQSEEFVVRVTNATKKINSDKRNKYIHIKEIVTELKAYGECSKKRKKRDESDTDCQSDAQDRKRHKCDLTQDNQVTTTGDDTSKKSDGEDAQPASTTTGSGESQYEGLSNTDNQNDISANKGKDDDLEHVINTSPETDSDCEVLSHDTGHVGKDRSEIDTNIVDKKHNDTKQHSDSNDRKIALENVDDCSFENDQIEAKTTEERDRDSDAFQKLSESEEAEEAIINVDLTSDSGQEDKVTEKKIETEEQTSKDIASEHAEEKKKEQRNEGIGKKTASKRQIQRLEKLLKDISEQIKKLEEAELSLDELDDDSAYTLTERYKAKFIKVWNKLCELKGRETTTGRVVERKFYFEGTRYPEINQKIQRFVNKLKIFPDYPDIHSIVSRCNTRHKLQMSKKTVNMVARDAFIEVGNRLQERRQKDYISNFGCHLTEEYRERKDPSLYDRELRKQLDKNQHVSKQNIQKVIDKYAYKQETNGDGPGDTSDSGEEEEETHEEKEEAEELASILAMETDTHSDVVVESESEDTKKLVPSDGDSIGRGSEKPSSQHPIIEILDDKEEVEPQQASKILEAFAADVCAKIIQESKQNKAQSVASVKKQSGALSMLPESVSDKSAVYPVALYRTKGSNEKLAGTKAVLEPGFSGNARAVIAAPRIQPRKIASNQDCVAVQAKPQEVYVLEPGGTRKTQNNVVSSSQEIRCVADKKPNRRPISSTGNKNFMVRYANGVNSRAHASFAQNFNGAAASRAKGNFVNLKPEGGDCTRRSFNPSARGPEGGSRTLRQVVTESYRSPKNVHHTITSVLSPKRKCGSHTMYRSQQVCKRMAGDTKSRGGSAFVQGIHQEGLSMHGQQKYAHSVHMKRKPQMSSTSTNNRSPVKIHVHTNTSRQSQPMRVKRMKKTITTTSTKTLEQKFNPRIESYRSLSENVVHIVQTTRQQSVEYVEAESTSNGSREACQISSNSVPTKRNTSDISLIVLSDSD